MEKISTTLNYGYYIFLGTGDYHQPKVLSKEWTSTWGLNEWKIFLESIVELKANTLMVYLSGHSLPYKSYCYPELVDYDHPNVKNEFFTKVLSLAKNFGLYIIIVLSTTGHSAKFLEHHPNLSIKIRPGRVNLNKLLSPFPSHIRYKKNLAQEGSAQIGLGIICHNKASVKEHVINIIRECLNLYPQIDGVALHPPESIYPCFCQNCSSLFKKKYEIDMLRITDDVARQFYLDSYLEFQNNYLEKDIKSFLPHVQIYTFTIPWLFELSFGKSIQKISNETVIIDWDYNLSRSRINKLHRRLINYGKYDHQIWFMPTAGFGLDKTKKIQHQINNVRKQIKIAIDSDVSGIIHFIGPYLNLDLKKTNFYVENQS